MENTAPTPSAPRKSPALGAPGTDVRRVALAGCGAGIDAIPHRHGEGLSGRRTSRGHRLTTSDYNGEFSLTGTVDDTTRFRATKQGHVTAIATILPNCDRCNPNRWVYFFLNVLAPPVAIAGDYTLTFVADSACGNLPDELRTRRYAVTIEPGDLTWRSFPAHSDTSFKVTPQGPAFSDGLNLFHLNVAGNYVNVSLGDHTDPGITERVAPNTYLAFGGWAGGVSVETPVSTIATAFQGWIDHCVNPEMGERYDCSPGPAVTRARCESKTHQLMLERR
jgi:hypothetical protein